MINKILIIILLLASSISISGCGAGLISNDQVLESSKSQVQLRSMQSRVFDSSDKKFVLRSVIATLQDLGFVIDKANEVLGNISATKLDTQYLAFDSSVKITVIVRKKNESQIVVRASAQYNVKEINEPIFYQGFFNSLSKAMYLEAHNVM